MRLVVNAERRIIWTASASWLRSLSVWEGMGNGNCRREVLSRAHCQARRLCARSVDVSHPVVWRVQFRPRPVRDTGRGRKRQADRAAGFDRFGAVGGGGRIFLRTGAGGGADAAALQAAAGRPDADANGSQGALLHETQNGRKNHRLISTVTGVAPFVSYVRTLSRTGKRAG